MTVAGTHNISDWWTDLYLAAGKLKSTNRYKEADKVLKEAKKISSERNGCIWTFPRFSYLGIYSIKRRPHNNS
jgi:hypothetical protein